MTTAKTIPTPASVDEFIAAIPDDRKRTDSERLREIMEEESGAPATMWGPSIVGFGSYHYRYATGHEGDAGAVGFSPRAQQMSIYIVGGFDVHEDILGRLGKHKVGKSCLYVKQLADIDEGALRELVRASIAFAATIDAASRNG